MENTTQETVDIQNKVDNFEAVIASGNVKLINQNDDIKLYKDDEGIEYIYDGSSAYVQGTEEFTKLKSENFGAPGVE